MFVDGRIERRSRDGRAGARQQGGRKDQGQQPKMLNSSFSFSLQREKVGMRDGVDSPSMSAPYPFPASGARVKDGTSHRIVMHGFEYKRE